MNNNKIIISALAIALLSGCVSTPKTNNVAYFAGDYSTAAQEGDVALGLVGENGVLLPVEAKPGAVLEHLNAAETNRLAGNIQRSTEHYDVIEVLFKDEDTEGLGTKAGEVVGAALVNDNMRSYEPTPTERILVNYYKALNFWSEGKKDFARVEFNRADERTRLAIENYAEDIDDKTKKQRKGISKQLLNNKKAMGMSADVNAWEVYDDYMNPAVSFTNALFLASESNIGRAEDSMARVESMLDVAEAEIFNIDNINEGHFWVITETGLGPILGENRYDIPWKVGNELIVLSMALPKIQPRQSTVNPSAYTLDGQYLKMHTLGSMEKLTKTELKQRWTGILTRSITSAIAKGVVQKAAAKQNEYLGFAASLLSAASTKADVRIWDKTPAIWSVAKFKNNGNNTLQIPYGQTNQIVNIPTSGSGIIYVKQPTSNAKPYVTVLEL